MKIGSIIPKSALPEGAEYVELVDGQSMRDIRDGKPSLMAWQAVSSGLGAAAQFAAGAYGSECLGCLMSLALPQAPQKRRRRKVSSRR